MNDGKKIPRSEYTVEEILAEEAIKKEKAQKQQAARAAEITSERGGRDAAPLAADDIVRSAREALSMESAGFPEQPPEKPKKKHRFFGRRKERADSIPEDDVYYGLQLKPLEEYKRDYEETIRLDTATLKKAEEAARRRRELLLAHERERAVQEDNLAAAQKRSAPGTAVPETPAPEPNSAAKPSPAEDGPEGVREASFAAYLRRTELKEEDVFGTAEQQPAPDAAEPKEAPAGESPAEASPEAQQPEDLSPEPEPDGTEASQAAEPQNAEEIPGPELPQPDAPVPPGEPLPAPQIPIPDQPEPQPEIGIPSTGPVIPAPEAPEPEMPAGISAGEPSAEKETAEVPPESVPVKESVSAPQIPVPDQPEPQPEIGIPAAGPVIPAPEAPEPEMPAGISAGEPSAEKETAEVPPESVPVKEPVSAPQAGEDGRAPVPETEPPARPVPRYRVSELPLHVISLNCMDDALASEASGYELPAIHAPEPLAFPPQTEEPAAAEPESVPEKAQESEPEPETGAGEAPAESVPDNVTPLPAAGIPAQKKGKKRFRFFGSDEDSSEADDADADGESELDDYGAPGDAPSVRNDLSAQVRRLALRFAVTGICAAVTILFSAVWEYSASFPQALHTVPQAFLTVELVFLAAAAAFSGPTLRSGLQGLFLLQANSDSAVSLAVLACAAQDIVFLFTGIPEACRVYSALAAAALFLNSAGKFTMARRILRNFRFLTSPEQKYAVQIFSDYNTALKLTKGLNAGEPRIAYQTKAGFLRHFLRHSYAESDPSEHISQLLAPIGFLASLALCITAAVLTGSAETALTAFTVSACVCVPFANLLSVNLPLSRLGAIAAKCGGMAVGWDAVSRFGDTNAVLLDAQDLFPRGTVVLTGIQTFAGQRIDDAILEATALTKAVGGPLSDLFSQIVKSRSDILPHVERPAYEDGLGVTGTVNDRMILVGTGDLLRGHGVDAPSRDYEEKYLRTGKVPLYLSSGGVLMAMFLVSYRTDRRRAAELRRLEYNGISLLVRSRDPNLTPDLIAACFGLSRHFIRVLPENLGGIYESLCAQPPERASAVIATKGRSSSMMRILTACIRLRGNISIGVALQTAGAALGLALAVFFTACCGLGQLTSTALVLFEAFWTAAVIFIPKIRRP